MRSTFTLALSALLALVVCLLPAAPATAQGGTASYDTYGDDAGTYGSHGDDTGYDGSYTYVKTIDGAASLTEGDTGDRNDLTVNQPVLVGDRVWVAPTGRLELVLSDGNMLRVDGGSELFFDSIATSPDRDDTETVIRLLRGNVQLVVVEGFLGNALPRIDTPNAALYAREPGAYRVTTAAITSGDWTQALVRRGSLEVVTRDGATVLRTDEEALVEGSEGRGEISLARAGRTDDLELWGQGLDRSARVASSSRYLDDSLDYRGSNLDDHGSWVSVDGSHAWRPRVSDSWRPYWDGRWRYTSLGYTWISHEPWGWVPYHYGTWDYVPSHGWVWFPGRRFAPAWVYWNWTDSYAAWVPVGYYSRHYDRGLRYGVYGWAGGHWSHYARWNFCPRSYVGHRDQRRFHRDADRYRQETRWATPRRGILTTDTRGLTPDRVRSGDIAEAFRGRGGAASTRGRTAEQLPDVTTFIARERMPENVQNRIVSAGRGLPGGDGAASSRRAAAGEVRNGGSGEIVRKPAIVGDRGGVTVRDNRAPRATRGTDGSSDAGVTSAGRGSSDDTWRTTRPRTQQPTGSQAGSQTERPRAARPESGTSRGRASSPPATAAPARGGERSAEPSRRPATVKPPAQRVMDGVRSRSPRTGGATSSGAESRTRATAPTRGTAGAGNGDSRTETRRPSTVRPPSRTTDRAGAGSSTSPSTSRSRARAPERSRPPTRSRATSPRSTDRRSSAGSGSSRSSSANKRSSPPSRSSSSASSGSSSNRRSSGASRSRSRSKEPPAS